MNLKNIFSDLFGTKDSKEQAERRNKFKKYVQDIFSELQSSSPGQVVWFQVKFSGLSSHEKLVQLSIDERVNFCLYLIEAIDSFNASRNSTENPRDTYKHNEIRDKLLAQQLRGVSAFSELQIKLLYTGLVSHPGIHWGILSWPWGIFLTSLSTFVRKNGLSENVKEILSDLSSRLNSSKEIYYQKQRQSFLRKIEEIRNDAAGGPLRPVLLDQTDFVGKPINDTVKASSIEDQQTWFAIFTLSASASGSKPSVKFSDSANQLIKQLGSDKFKKHALQWFEIIISAKEKEETRHHTYNDRTYEYKTYEFLSPLNIETLKGLVWCCKNFYDTQTLQTIANLGERCFRKIPGKGPAAASIGNACFYVLSETKGLEGTSHLSRLKLRVKQSSTQKLIEKYIKGNAEKRGISMAEIEDLAVSDYNLKDWKTETLFDDYKAIIEIEKIGATDLYWLKPDSSEQKSVPAFVKESHAAKFKKLKLIAKQIELSLSSQRDRLDRMFRINRKMSLDHFNKYYFDHGLMSFIARKLIWSFEENGIITHAFFHNNQWINAHDEPVNVPSGEATTVSLWHPVFAGTEEVKNWRSFLMENKIVQPLKQAFREVYLLTEAEINTRTYSNRMAAHLIKQHQFNSLAKIRGWQYALQGAFDNGQMNGAAAIEIPEFNIRAEFWTNEVNADDAYNDTGIWLYVSTDQVRFMKIREREPQELIEVPPIVFSEVMRDVDLFVGVASIGNDPAWQDQGGQPGFNNYWQSYSFGDLSEIAKTRKEILTAMLPRLKIAAISHIKDKFLVVKGKLRAYKIHLGSTNILMEPNDQYLCIVPDRSKFKEEKIFLPFEGDNGLSVIISKAFLLADDDKISDSTITSQINRR